MSSETTDRDSERGNLQESTIVDPEEGRIRSGGLLTERGLLLVVSENLFGKSFVISKPRSVIGRSSGCDIVVGDPLVSREHCVIESDGKGGYFLQDLGSRNATILNRKPLSRRALLCYGDRIVVGATVLRFFLAERVERK